MNCIVVGYGSIGKRHVNVLNKLNCRVAVVSRREIQYPLTYNSLSTALKNEKPDYVIVANETARHYDTLKELSDNFFNGTVMVEKPLFEKKQKIPYNNFKNAYVGYNLRFNPIIKKIYRIIRDEKVLFAKVYTGQYLPYWRIDRDYTSTYSAKKNEGGGVLLDLSHELDYFTWLFGNWSKLTAIGGKYSNLKIDCEDIFCITMSTEKSSIVQINLNYLDKIGRREITVITDKKTILADLVGQKIQINEKVIKYNTNRDYTYYMQHKAVLKGETNYLCSFEDGMNILDMVFCAKEALKRKEWIKR
jgi:predicted dehydrogenase